MHVHVAVDLKHFLMELIQPTGRFKTWMILLTFLTASRSRYYKSRFNRQWTKLCQVS